ncbi:glycosyltransferase family 2 protein [Myroides sp. 1354]|uniref:glycosyltransferase family 2 protein n=1 Tax=unclassified Myroides TaxID=2642485 RepID=UPI002575B67F|nr:MULTISPECIES: glycosyltransferase family 2 protein [unclassified Myroides]MDM1045955.1 glycosyltransferase family 2 protein [Myroides sp. R163-1]MDM1055805.1 glycosyltransferase family 2 protein [Myroides sp. 1354]MDM1069986.1 glycosyltransferase family 2 protein [Myroides sp. 1372]
MKKKITLLIPTKNEESNIRACILSAKHIVDEVYIVDSFSTDKTVELAQELGAQVLSRQFDNYSNQKNWAIEQMPSEWILLLDADEQLTPELEREILTLIEQDKLNEYDAYWVYRKNFFFNREIKYSGYQKDKVIRLFKKDLSRYTNRVHECLQVKGTMGFLSNKLFHNTYRGFDFHIAKLSRYASLQAEDYNKKTGKLTGYHFIVKPGMRFLKHYIVKQGFRDGVPGLILSSLNAYATFLRYVKLWMLRNNINN